MVIAADNSAALGPLSGDRFSVSLQFVRSGVHTNDVQNAGTVQIGDVHCAGPQEQTPGEPADRRKFRSDSWEEGEGKRGPVWGSMDEGCSRSQVDPRHTSISSTYQGPDGIDIGH